MGPVETQGGEAAALVAQLVRAGGVEVRPKSRVLGPVRVRRTLVPFDPVTTQAGNFIIPLSRAEMKTACPFFPAGQWPGGLQI